MIWPAKLVAAIYVVQDVYECNTEMGICSIIRRRTDQQQLSLRFSVQYFSFLSPHFTYVVVLCAIRNGGEF